MKEKLSQQILVVGAGEIFEKHVINVLNKRFCPEQVIIVDKDRKQLSKYPEFERINADAENIPLNKDEKSHKIALILTPEHLGVVKPLIDSGYRNFIIEKPIVFNTEEVQELSALQIKIPELQIYALDHYVPKILPLMAVAGTLEVADPRWKWLVDNSGKTLNQETMENLNLSLGEISGIKFSILEGGSFGLTDLLKRSWIMNDTRKGGILLDLGIHCFSSIMESGLIDKDSLKIKNVTLLALDDSHNFVTPLPDQPEIYANVLLSTRSFNKEIPVSIEIGKIPFEGGVWSLTVQTTKGSVNVGLRTGDSTVVNIRNGKTTQIKLTSELTPYQAEVERALLYFEGNGAVGNNFENSVRAIKIIDKIKKYHNPT